MERDNERPDELIDLGAASTETKGQFGTRVEPSAIGKPLGIADD